MFKDISNSENDFFYIYDVDHVKMYGSKKVYFYTCKCKLCDKFVVVRKEYIKFRHIIV